MQDINKLNKMEKHIKEEYDYGPMATVIDEHYEALMDTGAFNQWQGFNNALDMCYDKLFLMDLLYAVDYAFNTECIYNECNQCALCM